MKDLFIYLCTLLVKAALFFAVSILGVLISFFIMRHIPLLNNFEDFTASFFVSICMGVLYFFVGEKRQLTLIFTGVAYIVYMCAFAITLQSLKNYATSAVLIRCFLGTINMLIFLGCTAMLFGKQLGIIPVRRNEKE